MMEAMTMLLTMAFRRAIDEANIEAGFCGRVALAGTSVDCAASCDAAAARPRDGLIREPIHVSEGAHQCQWHLELTVAGAAGQQSAGSIALVPRQASLVTTDN